MNFVLPVILMVLVFASVVLVAPFLWAIIGYCFYNWSCRESFWSHVLDEYEHTYSLLFRC